MKQVFLHSRFFQWAIASSACFAFSMLWFPLFYLACLAFAFLFVSSIWESIVLSRFLKKLSISRQVDDKLSLNHQHKINYLFKHIAPRKLNLELFDEYPEHAQIRSSIRSFALSSEDTELEIHHDFQPLVRGIHEFGNVSILANHSFPGFVKIRKVYLESRDVKVVPNVLEMKEYTLQAESISSSLYGFKRVRHRGINDEFEQIKPYQEGDNIKHINWKASSRVDDVLVNQYQENKSQDMLLILDKSRVMEMPFNGLSLLDYAINSSLALSNIMLRKNDRVGLVHFDRGSDFFLAPNNSHLQLHRIMDALYKVETQYSDAGFEALYSQVRGRVNKRSIVFLFSNFMSLTDLNRNVKYIRGIAKRHLLVLIMFKNSGLEKIIDRKPMNSDDIIERTLAEDISHEKNSIIIKLQSLGVQTVLTSPEKLSLDVINKYLEIKARRLK